VDVLEEVEYRMFKSIISFTPQLPSIHSFIHHTYRSGARYDGKIPAVAKVVDGFFMDERRRCERKFLKAELLIFVPANRMEKFRREMAICLSRLSAAPQQFPPELFMKHIKLNLNPVTRGKVKCMKWVLIIKELVQTELDWF
jgi:hypothetical protein